MMRPKVYGPNIEQMRDHGTAREITVIYSTNRSINDAFLLDDDFVSTSKLQIALLDLRVGLNQSQHRHCRRMRLISDQQTDIESCVLCFHESSKGFACASCQKAICSHCSNSDLNTIIDVPIVGDKGHNFQYLFADH
jgi:hypothetical protein